MNPKEKDLAGPDLCKIHSARSDKEFYRICPSKLSKRELEDLYYSLLENNLNLKRTVNGQNEKIKQLAVKVQRMTAQRGTISRDPKDCCSGAKAIIDEQKETIAELKKTNDVMSERIRQLNMRLCTAKQFLKRNPNKAATRCYKCFAGSYMEASTSAKNLSTSAINTKSNENRSTAVSYQDLNKEISTARSVETNTANMDENNKKEIPVKLCDENKCRTTMDELKQKIVDLQEELSKTHTEYSTRISQLEGQVSELQTINIRVRSERVASEHRLQAKSEAEACMARLVKDAEIRKAELSMLLTIERKKVSELEMQLKSARMSGEVARAMQRLSTTSLAVDTSFPDSQQNIKDSLQVIRDRKDQTKSSDDSGYDHERSHNDKSFTKMDEVLMKRIADLQIQLEKLKETAVARDTYQPNEQSANDDSEFINIDRRDVSDYEYVIGPTKEVILEIEQVKGNVERAEKDDPIKSTGLETVVRFQESKIKLRTSTPQKDLKNEQKTKLEQSENFQEPKQLKIGEELKQIQGMSQVNKYQDSDKVDDRVCQEVSEYSQGVDDDDKMTRIDHNKGSNLENKPSKKKLKRTATNEIQERSSKHKEVCNSEERSKKKEEVYSSEEEKRDKKRNEEVNYSEEDKSEKRNEEVIYSKKNEDVYSSEEEKRGRKKHEEVSCNEEDKRSKGRKSWKKLIVECRQDINKNEPNKKYNEATKEIDETRKTDKGNVKHVCQCVNCPKKLNGKTVAERPTNLQDAGNMKSETDELFQNEMNPLQSQSCVAEAASRMNNNNDQYIQTDKMTTKLKKKVEDTKGIETNYEDFNNAGNDDRHLELCEKHATICKCPSLPRVGLTTLRSCDGAALSNIAGPLRRCKCYVDVPEYKNTKFADIQVHRRGSACSAATYTRASPDCTDREISSMTDLPTERGTSPRDIYSPGEQRFTSTYTETIEPNSHEYNSLSEGEMPNRTGRKFSIGERYYEDNYRDGSNGRYVTSSQRLEAALQAISDELTRCRALLRTAPAPSAPSAPAPSAHPQPQAELRDAATNVVLSDQSQITPLKRAKGKSSINDAYSPKCIFTLHIGTVVLSDEAVLNSRNVPLMLTWKFFEQSVAMSRMPAGRVVHFDFSTEYDVDITPRLLDYFKHEEMPITICEMNEKDAPFAVCNLPLREALLNANRRVDLSLALLAGPRLRVSTETADELDGSDELGVLDLWCMLRAEHASLNILHRTIDGGSYTDSFGQKTLNSTNFGAGRMLDDDQSNDYRLSQDLDLHMSKRQSNKPVSESDMDVNSVDHKKDFYVPEDIRRNSAQGVNKSDNVSHRIELKKEVQNKVPSNLPPFLSKPSVSSDLGLPSLEAQRLMSPQRTRWSQEYAQKSQKPSKPSGIILNEIAPKIRSPHEMKQVWDSYDTSDRLMDNNKNTRNPAQLIQLNGGETKDSTSTRMENANSNAYTNEKKKSVTIAPKHQALIKNDGKMDKCLFCAGEASAAFIEAQTKLPVQKRIIVSMVVKDETKQSIEQYGLIHHDAWSKEDNITGEQLTMDITVQWLALNEECDAMLNPSVKRLYVAYSFLGRDGAELETPVSLPKPSSYAEKCYFNFKKTFYLTTFDLPLLGHMARSRSSNRGTPNSKDCIVFSVVSEPPEDPLGLANCEDIGHAYLYLGDVLSRCTGDSFTEVVAVRAANARTACGVLAVRLRGLDVVRTLARTS